MLSKQHLCDGLIKTDGFGRYVHALLHTQTLAFWPSARAVNLINLYSLRYLLSPTWFPTSVVFRQSILSKEAAESDWAILASCYPTFALMWWPLWLLALSTLCPCQDELFAWNHKRAIISHFSLPSHFFLARSSFSHRLLTEWKQESTFEDIKKGKRK